MGFVVLKIVSQTRFTTQYTSYRWRKSWLCGTTCVKLIWHHMYEDVKGTTNFNVREVDGFRLTRGVEVSLVSVHSLCSE